MLGPRSYELLYIIQCRYISWQLLFSNNDKNKKNQTKQTYTPNKEGCLLKNRNKKF